MPATVAGSGPDEVPAEHIFSDVLESGVGLSEVFERWIDRPETRARLRGITLRDPEAVEKGIEGRFGKIVEWKGSE